MAWAALGGAYRAEGQLPEHPATWSQRRIEMERRALAIDPDLADAHAWLGVGAARRSAGSTRRSSAIQRGDPPRSRQRSGAPGAGARAVGRQGGLRRRDSGVRALDRAQPRSRLLVPAARAAAVVGRALRGSRACPAGGRWTCRISSSPGNAGLQMVGANARLGYVYYLQGRNDEAIREYERGMAFLRASDHALKERSMMELDIKLGAAYRATARCDEARAALRSRAQDLRVAGGQGRRRSVHALLHRRSARAARRRRPGLRFARARLREAAGADRRADRPRPRPRPPCGTTRASRASPITAPSGPRCRSCSTSSSSAADRPG